MTRGHCPWVFFYERNRMSNLIDGLLFGWKKNEDYAARLVADLSQEQMSLQLVETGAPANHPAWILSHLNVYLPVLEGIISGNEFEDPRDHRFGMLSKPESDPDLYESKDQLITTFLDGHQRVRELLQEHGDAALQNEIKLPRWQDVMPTAAYAIPYLMFNHENMHLGQLSAWRRIQGLPSV